MPNQAVYGIIVNRAKAEQIVQHLIDAGINLNDISYLSSQNKDFSEHTTGSNATERNWRTEERGSEDTSNFGMTHQSKNATGSEKNAKGYQGTTSGTTSGTSRGGAASGLGLLTTTGTLAIPGVGPFVAAGPILTALRGPRASTLTGGLIAALAGVGVPENEAKRYENSLKKGAILFAIRVKGDNAAKQTKDILKNNGAEDVTVSSETTTSTSTATSGKAYQK